MSFVTLGGREKSFREALVRCHSCFL